jgi:hypothetical protein
MYAGIGIRGKARAIFSGRSDMPDGRFFDKLEERQHIIAGNAENVVQAQLIQAVQKKSANSIGVIHTCKTFCHYIGLIPKKKKRTAQ